MKQDIIYQKEIRSTIIQYLTSATESIHLAIGWIDDSGLEGLLQKKLLEGVAVKMLLIKTTQEVSNLQQLIKQGAQITWVNKEHRELFIDHQFSIIDTSIVLTGNFGWNFKKLSVEHFLRITSELPTLAKGYEKEFNYLSILDQLSKNEPRPFSPITPLLKQLDIIKVLLNIGDTEFLHLRLKELTLFKTDKNVERIHNALLNRAFEEALELIKPFVVYHRPLRDCIDPPIDNLLREIRRLEEEIASVSNEYNETQKTLHKFSKSHSEYLGDLLQKILLQTKIKAKKEAELDTEKQQDYEEAKKDHEEYSQSYEQSKKQKLAVLSPQEQKELKKLYRQTSLRCHPDRVVEELHDQAEEIFVQLNEAYKANDLDGVKAISEQLKTGIMLSKSEGITELKKLESTVKGLLQKLNSWQEKLDHLKEMPTYNTISRIDDWNTYFTETKETLEQQLERLIEFNQSQLQDN